MQVAILAGGLGTRLKSLAQNTPKAMVEVWGRPFLEYQLDLLKKNNVRDIVLCLGHLGGAIEGYFGDGGEFGVEIKYSREGERLLGTAGALKNAEELLKEEFFVMYGDSYLFLDFQAAMSYFKGRNKLALMTVYKNYDQYDKSNVVVAGDLVKLYSKRERTKDMVYIDYGASILRKKTLELVPPNQVCSLEQLFSQLIEQEELLAFEVKERFYHIGTKESLEEFESFTSKRGEM
jgi:NDP-sugar pyrophosphorylase family protein